MNTREIVEQNLLASFEHSPWQARSLEEIVSLGADRTSDEERGKFAYYAVMGLLRAAEAGPPEE